jgi:hypothetical protein
MRLKLSTVQLIVTTGILTTAIICGNTLTAKADQSNLTRQEESDAQTDSFLYEVNPALNRRQLRSDDYGYIKEWKAIQQVVEKEMKASSFTKINTGVVQILLRTMPDLKAIKPLALRRVGRQLNLLYLPVHLNDFVS